MMRARLATSLVCVSFVRVGELTPACAQARKTDDRADTKCI
jgi:hypothetical protein